MKTLTGIVKSTKMTKSAVIEVTTFRQHPLYHKRFRVTKRFLAHNEIAAKEGEKVQITESRPLSKLKHWNITKIINNKN